MRDGWEILLVVAILAIPSAVSLMVDSDSVTKPSLAVMVIAGQSNSAYREVDLDMVNDFVSLPSHNVYYYGTEV